MGEGRSGSSKTRSAEENVSAYDARLWHPWLRINRVLRVMLQTRWSARAWLVVRVEFRRALALRSEIRRAGWFKLPLSACVIGSSPSTLTRSESQRGRLIFWAVSTTRPRSASVVVR